MGNFGCRKLIATLFHNSLRSAIHLYMIWQETCIIFDMNHIGTMIVRNKNGRLLSLSIQFISKLWWLVTIINYKCKYVCVIFSVHCYLWISKYVVCTYIGQFLATYFIPIRGYFYLRIFLSVDIFIPGYFYTYPRIFLSADIFICGYFYPWIFL